MTVNGSMNQHAPAGWYSDPEVAGYVRYWDGSSWTDRRAPESGDGRRTANGVRRVFSLIAVALVLIGAALFGLSAWDAAFDLGEDLELGKAVHATQGGPEAAAILAALLAVVALVALMRPSIAGWLLLVIGVVSLGLVVVLVVTSALVEGDQPDVGLDAIPFTLFFVSLPCLTTSLLLRTPKWMSS
jgi:FtsH-binding integral membrane protein